MKTISKVVGINVRKAREKVGLLQSELCKLADIEPSYLSNLENGRKNPTIATLEKIALALNISLDDLVK